MTEQVVCVVTYNDTFLVFKVPSAIDPEAERWEFISGPLRYDTDVHERALKEVKRQTGLPGTLRYAGMPFYSDDATRVFPVHLKVTKNEVTLKEQDYLQYAWVPASDLDSQLLSEVARHCLKVLSLPE